MTRYCTHSWPKEAWLCICATHYMEALIEYESMKYHIPMNCALSPGLASWMHVQSPDVLLLDINRPSAKL